jgi:C_GCAxxG_C_C family probable redox protein
MTLALTREANAMSRPETAVEIFRNEHACSQAVLLAFAPDCGLSVEDATRVAAGFGGGMRLGSTCGAVTGAAMVLGLALCDGGCNTGQGRVPVNEAVIELGERFTNRLGSTECAGLLGHDIRTPEGAAQVKEQGLFDTVCIDAVREAAIILEDLLPAE